MKSDRRCIEKYLRFSSHMRHGEETTDSESHPVVQVELMTLEL